MDVSDAIVVVVAIVVTLAIVLVTVTLARGVFLAQRAATAHMGEIATLGARVESFVGGARWPLGNATLPLARLDFHQFGIRIHGSVRVLDWILPDWHVLYQDIVGCEAVAARMMMTGGLRLRTSRSDGWIIFWTTRSVEDLLARLAKAGVPVESTHQRVSFWTARDL
jgi:hypothetical protein